jgi:perosamine synthetase
MTDDEANAAAECIRNGWLTMGKRTIDFENQFAAYIGSAHAISLCSCTAALHLALVVYDLREGDEVIVPSMTFAASAEVIRYFKAVPVVADVDRDTHLIDPDDVERRITPRTRGIIPVHYAGNVCDMDGLAAIAKRHNLFIVEDAAHSLPSRYKGKLVGTLSDITCFSFYATKTLATGEGGMITTNSDEIADRLKMLRLHGISRDAWKRYTGEGTWRYDVFDAGFKYNSTDIASSIGMAQLAKLDLMNDRRTLIARRYSEAFAECDSIIPYRIAADCQSSWHLYPLRLNPDVLSISRDQFIDELKLRGIHASVHFIPLYRFTYYKQFCKGPADYPGSEWIFERTLSLPIYPGMNDEEIDYVISTVLDLCRLNRRQP